MKMARMLCIVALAVLPAGAIAAPPALSAADRVAAFKAAGFKLTGKQWRSGCDDPGTPSYTPGEIEAVGDLNGDGKPEAVITEGGSYCYGNTGTAFTLVSKQGDGRWSHITDDVGIPEFLKTKGVGGWPDISIGGPGFCFPVQRWNGKAYVVNRHEYEGKACRPPRP